jgi:5'-nucleotidase
MNILVTNDDGIGSKGLWALARALNRVGQVTIIAPDKERSGVGSCLSMRSDLHIIEVPSDIEGVTAYALDGTPGDCVMFGTRKIQVPKFDLVVSGINPGPNIGTDVHYSGTVMATLESYYQKIPAIAVSLYTRSRTEKMDFELAAEAAEHVARQIKSGKLQTDAVVNLNVPNIPRDRIKGILTTRTAETGYVTPAKHGGKNTMNYTLELDEMFNSATAEGTDIWAIQAGYISVSLLRFKVDHQEIVPAVKECMQALESEFLGKSAKLGN